MPNRQHEVGTLVTDQTDQLLEARVRHAQWAIGGAAAASFASILTLVALQRDDLASRIALVALVAALPLLVQYPIVNGDPRRHYDVSVVMKAMPLAGILFFVIGIASLLCTAFPPAAITWVVLSVLVAGTIADAEKRGLRRRARRAAELFSAT